jgi:hypothetical protein
MTIYKIERLGLYGRYPNVGYLTMRRKELVLQVTTHHSIDASKIVKVICQECEGKLKEIDQIKTYARQLATRQETGMYACELHQDVTADNAKAIKQHQIDTHEARMRDS